MPLDFFQNETRYEPHTNATFNLRYFFDAQYYKPGGPIFVLLSGETSAVNRLGFLQKGIVNQVAKATNGIGVILEHRYYGTSHPFLNVSTANLRFLSTEQSLAEIDYFARNVKFDGIDADLTAPNTPWIVYGGSYAGAQAAFLRVAYPDTFLGTISSSGVTAEEGEDRGAQLAPCAGENAAPARDADEREEEEEEFGEGVPDELPVEVLE